MENNNVVSLTSNKLKIKTKVRQYFTFIKLEKLNVFKY